GDPLGADAALGETASGKPAIELVEGRRCARGVTEPAEDPRQAKERLGGRVVERGERRVFALGLGPSRHAPIATARFGALCGTQLRAPVLAARHLPEVVLDPA